MPPKKKGKGKKGKGKKGDAKEEAAEAPQEAEFVEPSDRENILQKELDGLTTQLSDLKKEVDSLRQENEFLQQEAQQTRIESHEYMSYMAKRTHKRQTTIISLSDQNEQQLQNIKREKEIMLQEYDEKKKDLNKELLAKENLLAKAKIEFQDLAEYRDLRDEQLKRIKQLEREVLRMRGKHSDTIQQLKAQFLQEKAEYTTESHDKINDLTQEANKKSC